MFLIHVLYLNEFFPVDRLTLTCVFPLKDSFENESKQLYYGKIFVMLLL